MQVLLHCKCIYAVDSLTSEMDEFITGWFDHYSREYLGTVPVIDGDREEEDGIV